MLDPISIGLFLAGAALGVVVIAFWKEIREFFIAVWQKLPENVKQDLKGVVVLAQAIDRAIMTNYHYYSYSVGTNTWNETIVTQSVTSQDIPEHIKQRLKSGNEIDITDDFSRELNLTL